MVYGITDFEPGGRVKTHDLDVRGTMTMSTNGLTVSGSLIAATDAGSFTTSTGVYLISRDSKETLSGNLALQNVTLDNGLVGYWKLDDGSGSTVARDSSRYGNHGTLTAMDPSSDWVANPAHSTGSFFNPYALDFDGTDDYVDIGTQSIHQL